MSGRDFGRGGRGNFGERRGGFNDRDDRRGGFRDRDREGGSFRDRDRNRQGRDFNAPASRPWEREERGEQVGAPLGDRPFDRPARERNFDRPERSPRPERFGDAPERAPRSERFGGPRDEGRPTPPPARPAERSAPLQSANELRGAAAAAARPTPAGWSQQHLLDSWNDEQRLRGWTPGNQDLQEMVEDNIEADPQVPGRDRRAITVQASNGVVTLTGTVRSRAVKFAAGSDAYWTYGVQDVLNELTVKPRGPQAAGEAAPAPASTSVVSQADKEDRHAPTAQAEAEADDDDDDDDDDEEDDEN